MRLRPPCYTGAMQDEQEVGPESQRDRKRVEVYEPWLALTPAVRALKAALRAALATPGSG